MRRRDFLASLPLAAAQAQARRPNILLLFPDQHRFDWDGAHAGIPVRTPNLDGLRKRGVAFTKAIVASPVCAPSRACLAAGKEYEQCRVAGNNFDFPLDQTTYYRLLRDSGYHVAGCGKLDLHKKTEDWGLDGKRCLTEWGFSDGIDNEGKRDAVRSGAIEPKGPYMAYLHKRGLAQAHVEDFKKRREASATFPTPLPEEAYCDNWLANNGLELMRRIPQGKPWHLVVNFTGPHEPMDITKRMDERCRGTVFQQPHGNKQFSPETHVAIRQNYAAMIENIDRWVGTFLDEVKKRGELDNTLVVFSSDHGEMLGDHNRWGKSIPFQQSIGVPLIAAGPGVRGGAQSDALVSVMDLAATFLDYGGIAKPKDMQSLSLRALLEGRTRKHREFARSGLAKWRAVWDGRYKLVRGFADEQELFDLESDPWEDRNIAAQNPTIVKKLSEVLV
jgi:arylsulfatase A-like enzyme